MEGGAQGVKSRPHPRFRRGILRLEATQASPAGPFCAAQEARQILLPALHLPTQQASQEHRIEWWAAAAIDVDAAQLDQLSLQGAEIDQGHGDVQGPGIG